MGFPLKDWIDAHAGARHNLARSGMRGTLSSVRRALKGRRPDPDPERLSAELAAHLRVPRRRLFLTHGATEANALSLGYLRARTRDAPSRTVRWVDPEYPPLGEAARWAGHRRTSGPADVVVLSSPNNPTGRALEPEQLLQVRATARWVVVDETFREFTERPSLARVSPDRLFATGTFTKAWAGDALRVGFVVVPPGEEDTFASFHGIVADELPLDSVSGARALLASATDILSESRARFRANARALAAQIADATGLEAPVWFDRLGGSVDGDRFARALLRRGILVCPGRYFGAPRGVRLCLTQPTFPEDLAAYLAARRRWTS